MALDEADILSEALKTVKAQIEKRFEESLRREVWKSRALQSELERERDAAGQLKRSSEEAKTRLEGELAQAAEKLALRTGELAQSKQGLEIFEKRLEAAENKRAAESQRNRELSRALQQYQQAWAGIQAHDAKMRHIVMNLQRERIQRKQETENLEKRLTSAEKTIEMERSQNQELTKGLQQYQQAGLAQQEREAKLQALLLQQERELTRKIHAMNARRAELEIELSLLKQGAETEREQARGTVAQLRAELAAVLQDLNAARSALDAQARLSSDAEAAARKLTEAMEQMASEKQLLKESVEKLKMEYPARDLLKKKELEIERVEKELQHIASSHPKHSQVLELLAVLKEQRDCLVAMIQPEKSDVPAVVAVPPPLRVLPYNGPRQASDC